MKMKTLKVMALVLAMTCIFCFPVQVSAATQGTDGTEMEVIQPSQMEIQLGESWAGVEFELKTDAGMYPDSIAVGEDGILSLEIGGSEKYVLTCLNSAVEAPKPGETQGVDASESLADATQDPEEEGSHTTEESASEEETAAMEIPEDARMVDDISVLHIVLFIVGLILAIGALVGLWMNQKKDHENSDDEDDEY